MRPGHDAAGIRARPVAFNTAGARQNPAPIEDVERLPAAEGGAGTLWRDPSRRLPSAGIFLAEPAV